MSNTGEKLKWHERLRRLAENLGISFLAAAVVTAYFESRLENSKDHATALITSQEHFDASHNDVVAQVGLYANDLLLDKTAPDKDRILSAIIETQSQLLDLRSQLKQEDYVAIASYGDELNRLSARLSAANKETDLKPVYQTVQRLLDDHEEIDKRVRSESKISIF